MSARIAAPGPSARSRTIDPQPGVRLRRLLARGKVECSPGPRHAVLPGLFFAQSGWCFGSGSVRSRQPEKAGANECCERFDFSCKLVCSCLVHVDDVSHAVRTRAEPDTKSIPCRCCFVLDPAIFSFHHWQIANGLRLHHASSHPAGRFCVAPDASIISTRSDISQSRSVTPAAIAGMIFRV